MAITELKPYLSNLANAIGEKAFYSNLFDKDNANVVKTTRASSYGPTETGYYMVTSSTSSSAVYIRLGHARDYDGKILTVSFKSNIANENVYLKLHHATHDAASIFDNAYKYLTLTEDGGYSTILIPGARTDITAMYVMLQLYAYGLPSGTKVEFSDVMVTVSDVPKDYIPYGQRPKINAQDFANMIEPVYENGYVQGAMDNTPSVNPSWRSWSYMFSDVERKDLFRRMKFEDTSRGTNFSYMFYGNGSIGGTNHEFHNFDTSNGTDFSRMFYNCVYIGLNNVVPELDTSKGTNFTYMHYSNKSLKTAPSYDLSNATDVSSMFYNCVDLVNVPDSYNTSNVTNFSYMFCACSKMTVAPAMDTSKMTVFAYMFQNCSALTTVPRFNVSSVTQNLTGSPPFYNCSKLTYIGIEGEIPRSFTVAQSPLTYECAKNILNALKDYSGTTTTYTLTLNTKTKGYLSESDIAIATQKGWTVA